MNSKQLQERSKNWLSLMEQISVYSECQDEYEEPNIYKDFKEYREWYISHKKIEHIIRSVELYDEEILFLYSTFLFEDQARQRFIAKRIAEATKHFDSVGKHGYVSIYISYAHVMKLVYNSMISKMTD